MIVDPGTSVIARGKTESQQMQRLSWSLRIGLVTSAVLFSIGLLDFLARHPGEDAASALASNPISGYLTLSGLAQGLATGHAQVLLVLGILGLVATTVFRVAFAGAYFYTRREGPSTILSGCVTALLLFGILFLGPMLR